MAIWKRKRTPKGALSKKENSKEQNLETQLFQDEVDDFITEKVGKYSESSESEELAANDLSDKEDSTENFTELYEDSSSIEEDESVVSLSESEVYSQESQENVTESEMWGVDRKNYYVADVEDAESLNESELETVMKEEEEESRRLQEQQLSALNREDLEFSQWTSANENLEKEADISEPQNWSNLSEEDKLRLVEKESPELTKLLENFQDKAGEVIHSLEPILDKGKSFKNAYSDGMSFLELKYHLLLNYCINIAYFMLLKAKGKTVNDHPVLDQLIELRVVMEKMKPIEEKLQYQIHKLVQLARGEEESTVANEGDDEKSLKPNPASLISFENESDVDYEQDVELEEKKQRPYRPPRISPAVDVKSVRRTGVANNLEAKQRDKVEVENWKDSYMEMEEVPETLRGGLISQDTEKLTSLLEAEKERQKYEEENFTRLFTEKKEQKLQRKMHSLERDSILGSEFGQEFDSLVSMADHLVSSNLKDHTPNDTSWKNPEEGSASSFADSDGTENDSSASEIEDDLSSRKRKSTTRNIPKSLVPGEIPKGSRRKAHRALVENRGLTPKRKKILRNPRVKHKIHFDKAQKKRKGIAKTFTRVNSGVYRGESSGINVRK